MNSRPLTLLRFSDLKAANVVTSWPQLKRLVDQHGFPPGFKLSPAVRVFPEHEVLAWVAARRKASANYEGI